MLACVANLYILDGSNALEEALYKKEEKKCKKHPLKIKSVSQSLLAHQ